MTIETQPRDSADILATPADIAAYLDAYLEDGTPEELRRALGTVARSHGMSALARERASAAKPCTKLSAIKATRHSTRGCA
jgi:probable addiction module antidote protein